MTLILSSLEKASIYLTEQDSLACTVANDNEELRDHHPNSKMSFAISAIMESLPGRGNSAALRAAGKAMAELGVAGCIGATCVHREYISADIIRALSHVTFTVLLPMFLGTGILKTVTTYGIQKSSMSVPLMAILHSFLMFQISKHWLLPLFRIDGDAELMSCSFGNSGVLPFMFAESLFRHQPDKLAKCYANISLFLVGVTPFFWSLGFAVLVRSKVSILPDNSTRPLAGMKRLFPPPVIGVMTGLILAVSPLRPLFLISSSEQTAPLGVIYDSFQTLGRAANPLALLVLTCSLAMSVTNKGTVTVEYANVDSGNFFSQWTCVAIARFLVSPATMVVLLSAMARIGMIESSSNNPMLWFVMLLESCMPPAQNSVLMLQVANRGAEAARMAKFLFWLYGTAVLPLVAVVTVALRALALA